jgi:glutamate/aspartate transport system substrate-binding protein
MFKLKKQSSISQMATIIVAILFSNSVYANKAPKAAPVIDIAASPTLAKIKSANSITIGHRESSIPFSYLNTEQKPIGYSMDLCHMVVKAIQAQLKLPNLEIKYVPVTSSNRIPLVQNGTVDLECGSTTNNVERQKQVSFAVTTFVSNIKMAVKVDSDITSIEQLAGKPVVTTQGTTSDTVIKAHELINKIDVKNTYGKDHADSFLNLETGRAAAFVMDDILLAGLIANSKEPAKFKIVGKSLKQEPYGIMLRKDDMHFKKMVDSVLMQAMKSGQTNKLYQKWFTQAIAPKNINLNFPISAELKAAFSNPNDKGAN